MLDGHAHVAAVTAIVHSVDGVRFVTTGVSQEAVVSRLAEYVRQRYDHVLWPDAASRVRDMLDVGNLYAAIALYFERVGERWDVERLEFVTVGRERRRWTSNEEITADAR